MRNLEKSPISLARVTLKVHGRRYIARKSVFFENFASTLLSRYILAKRFTPAIGLFIRLSDRTAIGGLLQPPVLDERI